MEFHHVNLPIGPKVNIYYNYCLFNNLVLKSSV